MNYFPLKLEFVICLVLLFCPLCLLSQGKYLKVVGASEYVELHHLQFEETFNKSSFENPVYKQSPLHEKLFGLSFISTKENKGFWELGFLIGNNPNKSYYIPVSNTNSVLYGTENVYNSQINFSKNLFQLSGENKNLHFGLCYNVDIGLILMKWYYLLVQESR